MGKIARAYINDPARVAYLRDLVAKLGRRFLNTVHRNLPIEGFPDRRVSLPGFPRFYTEHSVIRAGEKLERATSEFMSWELNPWEGCGLDAIEGVEWLSNVLGLLRKRWALRIERQMEEPFFAVPFDIQEWEESYLCWVQNDEGEDDPPRMSIYPEEMKAIRWALKQIGPPDDQAADSIRFAPTENPPRVSPAVATPHPQTIPSLTIPQRDVIQALLTTHPRRLGGRKLREVSRHHDARSILGNLSNMPGWGGCILMAKKPYGGYGIDPDKLPSSWENEVAQSPSTSAQFDMRRKTNGNVG